ncbi:MAG: hypothetical protein L6Q59_11225 [Ignavibacteriaceae bacterium]|nr:hypothetical protein [Ignavibacteriaceae bacterium]
MGQQQLLLIVLSMIIVGIAIIIGINVYNQTATDQKAEQLVLDCAQLARRAQEYYFKPAVLGGGGNSFTGWYIPASFDTTYNGIFSVSSITSQMVVIEGTDVGSYSGTDPVRVQMTIYPKSITSVRLE